MRGNQRMTEELRRLRDLLADDDSYGPLRGSEEERRDVRRKMLERSAVDILPALLDVAEAAREAEIICTRHEPGMDCLQSDSGYRPCSACVSRRDLQAALARLEEGT